MVVELYVLGLASLIYLGLLFLLAELTEIGIVPASLPRHPVVFALSLGVYATSWTYYGGVGLAREGGYRFLAIYLGITIAALLFPVVGLPILRVVRARELASIADLFAYRFHSRALGMTVAVFMLVGSLPYLSLQVRAVAETAYWLAPELRPSMLAVGFCAMVAVFAMLFGARHLHPRELRPGLVVAVAFESLVKLTALVVVALVGALDILGGLDGAARFIETHPKTVSSLFAPVREEPFGAMLALSFCAAYLLPRQFQMTFAERPSDRALIRATWLFPLFLMLLNLPIPLILWAGGQVDAGLDPDLFVLAVAAQRPWLAVVAFLGGLSAASAMVIVTSLALASMLMNHAVLPLWQPRGNLYWRLLYARRFVVGFVVFLGWMVYVQMGPNGGLAQVGLVSFVAVAQLAPGLAGVVFWSGATQRGILAGLLSGILLWFALLVLPAFGFDAVLGTGVEIFERIDAAWANRWTVATIVTLGTNAGVSVLTSLVTRADPMEETAAAFCMRRAAFAIPHAKASSTATLLDRMRAVLGSDTAEAELTRALRGLNMSPDERRPRRLRRLAEVLERDLSALVGPLPAQAILQSGRPDDAPMNLIADQVRFVEERVRDAELSRAAKPLEKVRRYLRQVLEELPVAVCVLDATDKVVLVNRVFQALTKLDLDDVVGLRVTDLPAPWATLWSESPASVMANRDRTVMVDNHPRFLRLAAVALTEEWGGGRIVVAEDLTEQRSLESQAAHRDRLASVGELAAGVAHEVGNPLTGILMVVRNLQREVGDQDLRQRLDTVIREGERIKGIVRSLVDFSRSSADPREPGLHERKKLAVDDVVREAVDLLRIGRRDRGVECRIVPSVPSDVVGDRTRLVQVVLNLLTNACDASERNGLVEIGWRPVDERVALYVRDEGIGMPKDVQARMVEPFFTTKDPGQGTGLGLSVVQSIVRAHGGELRVQSEAGHGTSVEVVLPGPGGRSA